MSTLVAPTSLDPGAGVSGAMRTVGGRAFIMADRMGRWLRRGRHSSRLPGAAGRALASSGDVTFRLGSGGRLSVAHADGYCLRHLLFERGYEPDVDALLSRVVQPGDAFIDCGANIGLWSVALSAVIDAPERVLAVESSRRTFERLERNARANGDRFTVLHRAISDRDDDVVAFFASASDHASSSVIEGLAPADAVMEEVDTISLDSLFRRVRAEMVAAPDPPVVILKLDVEGLEAALVGTMDPAVDGDVLVVYEDHGRDRTHETTRAVLEAGFSVSFIREDGSLADIDIARISTLDGLKRNRRWGYNLVAATPHGTAIARLGNPGVAPPT